MIYALMYIKKYQNQHYMLEKVTPSLLAALTINFLFFLLVEGLSGSYELESL